MGFEFHNFEQEGPRIPHEAINRAYERALKVLSSPIDPHDFNYKDTDSDIAYVKRMEQLFAEEARGKKPEDIEREKVAKIFEAIIFEQIEQSNWFGEGVTTTQPSKYDDIKNKVDAIVELPEGKTSATHLALAMDVTTADHFGPKFDHIKAGIDRGELAKVKYFISEALNIKGEKSGIPHMVIGVDKQTVYDLLDTWIKGDSKKMANHPVQIKILAEVKFQLEAYKKYAEKIGQEGVVRSYSMALATLEKIIADKKITPAQLKATELDGAVYAIKMSAENIGDRKSPQPRH